MMRSLNNIKDPLVILLAALGVLSCLTDDLRATAVICLMVLLGVVLRFYQEMRADNTSEKLKANLASANIQNPLDLPNICFLGSNVESESATDVVVHIGDRTYFGSLATCIIGQRVLTTSTRASTNSPG
jgi:magnesium-transporting ATPase (P-type)